MITQQEIEDLGFTRIPSWDFEDDKYPARQVICYVYYKDRSDCGLYAINRYRLEVQDYGETSGQIYLYNLKSWLVRTPDFSMQTRGFLGVLDTVSELEVIFEAFKDENSRIG
jgi:hypothetical protein